MAMTARGAAMASAIMEENIIVVAEYGVCLVLLNKFLKGKRATGLLLAEGKERKLLMGGE
jgi:hypothetical protein